MRSNAAQVNRARKYMGWRDQGGEKVLAHHKVVAKPRQLAGKNNAWRKQWHDIDAHMTTKKPWNPRPPRG